MSFSFSLFIHQFLSLSGSLSSSSVTCSCLRPPNSSSPDFPFSCEDWGKWGEMALLKRRLSKCLMHYNEKRHLYTHKAFSVSVRVGPPQRGRIPSSSQPDDAFPTHLFFSIPLLPQTSTQYLFFFFFLSLFSVNTRVPCFPLGCPVGCVNVP